MARFFRYWAMDVLQPQKARGMVLLYQRCASLDNDGGPQPPAADRLETLIGGDLTRFLLVALVRDAGGGAAA